MYTVPVTIADSSEIRPPKYIDFQTVQRKEGRSRFQAVLPSISSRFGVPSFSSTEHAFVTRTSRLLAAR